MPNTDHVDVDGEAPVVAVVGSMMTDLVTYVERSPGPGETVVGHRFTVGFGGKGANQAVMARRLGARVEFVGCVGDDDYGERIQANLERNGIEVGGLRRRPGPSGVAPIWVDADGTNRIIVVPGSNHLVTPDDARAALGRLDRLDAVVGQLEIPQAATASAFACARERGAVTVLNPAPFASLSAELLAGADWLLPNEPELLELAAATVVPGMTGPIDLDVDAHLVALADALGCRLAVTLGARGAVLVLDGTVHRVPAEPVRARDTTGAGDAFAGAFSAALALGVEPRAAAGWAGRCATWSVQHDGTQASYPDADTVRSLR